MTTEQLIKYIEGNSTQEEKEAVARWLVSDEQNRKEFMNLRKSYDLTLANLKDHSSSFPQKRVKKHKHIVYELVKIAAIVILSFGSYYLFDLAKKGAVEEIVMHTFHVPAGQRAELTLADGTNVWLNAKTMLTFPSRFTRSNREVHLDGEAYFTVEHDPAHPFTVRTEKYAVKVLGTEFNVTAYQASGIFETSLLKGAVEIESLATDESIRIDPDQRVYVENGKMIKAPIEYYGHFLWKDGLISFENERLETIIDKLRLYYDVDIEVINKKILDIPYTGKFWTKDGIEHVIKVLQFRAKFKYTKDSERNLITIY